MEYPVSQSVVIYRATKTIVTCRTGVECPALPDPIRTQKPDATVAQLMEALDHFHVRQLTPSSCDRGVWEAGRASDYIPGPEPEKAIQKALRTALNYWFHGVVRAETEDTTAIGRIDVQL